ncbi:MAG: SPOR domain-containing protein [Rhodospirillales bacterium]|nr:SPOR domain-containing protein [Rhodospirillales bacterium]
MIRATLPLAAALALAGCGLLHHRPPPAQHVRYTVGKPYNAGGQWHYPRVFGHYDRTGLSTLIAPGPARLTADGEAYRADSLTVQSPVLPLPSIVRITNLDTGRSLAVRVNDRGPMQAGRIVAVTPRVARLLGMPADGVAEVRVQLLAGRSAALQGSLGAGPHLTAAPVGAVAAAALPPPPGAGGSAGAVSGTIRPATAHPAGVPGAVERLSGVVRTAPPSPGPLYVEIPGFGSTTDAMNLRARLAGMPGAILPQSAGGRTLYALRLGPYASVPAADAALRSLLDRGVAGAEIVVR